MNIPHNRIHIVGIGGSGMSALAKLLVARGFDISGSDLRGGAAIEGLQDLGIEVVTGHRPQVALTAELVVASSAVPDHDEELAAARAAGVPVWRRPELLASITDGTPTIGATGTHGKTTTTALMLSALRATGADPSFILGGELVDLGTNGHSGSSDLLVLEVDEAFRTFESVNLDGLIVTNVEAEHVDHFGSERDLLDSFISVAAGVDGPVLACADDAGSKEVAEAVRAETYGFAASADWRLADMEKHPGGSRFRLLTPAGDIEVKLTQPGAHVALNATGAVALLATLGHDLDELVAGVQSFRGVSRRWEHRGTVAGVLLYDDYAHHPTEVKATLDAASGLASGRVWAVFQPHLYSRTERFKDEFGVALSSADVVVVTDIYGAREAPVPGVTGRLVADAARANGAAVHYVRHRAELASFLEPMLAPGDLVISMGAGDITLLHSELSQLLGARS